MSSRTARWPSVGGTCSRWRRSRDAETRAAPARVHPHPLDLADARRPAPGRRHRPRARRRWMATTKAPAPGAMRSSSWWSPGSKPVGNRTVELVEVAVHRLPRRRRAGCDRPDVDGRRPDQQVGGGQRLGQPLLLPVGQRRDEPLGELLGAVVQPRRGARGPAPVSWTVRRRRSSGSGAPHQAVVLEPAQQPAQVAGVEVEPSPQVARPSPRPRRSRRAAARHRAAGPARGTTRRARRSAACRCG